MGGRGLCASLSLLLVAPGAAPGETGDTSVRRAVRSAPVSPWVYSGDVRDLPRLRWWQPGDPIRFVPQRGLDHRAVGGAATDPLGAAPVKMGAARLGPTPFTQPSRNLEGLEFSGAVPPDPVGDVGPSHYIQMTNGFLDAEPGVLVRIFDKAQPVPNEIATFRLATLAGDSCEGGGDPIALYDRQADRWVLSEFSSSYTSTCVYVSQSGDPVAGGWYAYELVSPSFPDYPKLAVWPTDANGGAGSYVLTTNEDSESAVYALERAAMLAGAAVTYQRVAVAELPAFALQILLPAEPDGPSAPPPGAPAVLMRHRDTEIHGGLAALGDVLEMWTFDVDWIDTGNTTFAAAPSIDVADFDSDLCGAVTVPCLEQPGTYQRLFSLKTVLMHRLQYMNRGGFETIVGNYTVDATGLDRAGIRWFELRRAGGGPWSLFQEGTYAPDTDHRWVGSIAMDRSGNIALGYHRVSESTFASTLYTGRGAGDVLGVMTEQETILAAGVDANPNPSWGDYASMNLDPADDCAFWFTGEHSCADVWCTQIASFHFDSCPCAGAPAPPAVQATAPSPNRIDVSWDDSSRATVVEYRVQRSRSPGGPFETLASVADTSPGAGGGAPYAFADTEVSGGTTYHYFVTAVDEGGCSSGPVSVASAIATGDCTLRPAFAGVLEASTEIDTCTVSLSWSRATAHCGGPVTYDVYRSTAPGQAALPENLLVSGLTGTTVTDVSGLSSGDDYYYLARAVDRANGMDDGNVHERSVTVVGPPANQPIFVESFENPATFSDWTVTTGPGPHACGEWALTTSSGQRPIGGSGTYARAMAIGCSATSASLTSPEIGLDLPSFESASVAVWISYKPVPGDFVRIEVWNGTGWGTVWSLPGVAFDDRWTLDVSSLAGLDDMRLRFDYQNGVPGGWYSVDNISVSAVYGSTCQTANAPPPAPDGSPGTTPLMATRLDAAGATIGVAWDATTCPATSYNVLYGDLAGVATHTLDGAVCDIGAGSFEWNAVPAGNLFFLVVGFDGTSTEGSWGQATAGERNGLTPSGRCSASLKNVASTCP